MLYLTCVITGSIAHSAMCRYLSYLEADFEVFCPAGATWHVALMGVKFGMEEGTFGVALVRI